MARSLHQARDWAGDAWASLTDSEAAGAGPSSRSGSVEGAVQGPARAAVLRVQALFVLGLTEVQQRTSVDFQQPCRWLLHCAVCTQHACSCCAAADILSGVKLIEHL